ncbi:MAG: hypothetical protein ACJ0FI_05255 [Gammaproteobacteria bacterium]
MPIQGGPDTLRAVYGVEEDDGTLRTVAGDGLWILLSWDQDGALESKSIHNYGSATQDSSSKHYNDQVQLFVEEKNETNFFIKKMNL